MRPEDPIAPATTGFVLVDRVSYDDASPWPLGVNATGNGLHRKGPHTFGNFAASWDGAGGTPGSVSFAVVVPGDFEPDGDVDGDDLTTWKTGFGIASGANSTQGDTDLDGDVDGADFLAWQRNFGSGTAILAVQSPPATSITSAAPTISAALDALAPLVSTETLSVYKRTKAAKRTSYTPASSNAFRSPTYEQAVYDQAFTDAAFTDTALPSPRSAKQLAPSDAGEFSYQIANELVGSQAATRENDIDSALADHSLPELFASSFKSMNGGTQLRPEAPES